MAVNVGVRVVRGPEWKWGNQDDGDGHLGTIVEIGRQGSSTSPDKTVVVQWDCGTRTNYRVGYQGAYDLLLFDNAPAGIKHQNITCNGCKQEGIQGMRWKCISCEDYDLCSACYFAGKHDHNHEFVRLVTQSSAGARVSKRQNCAKTQVRGLLPGARVVRGADWDWGDQDGGDGKAGNIINIRGWEQESGRSVANVTWGTSLTNVYRIGHKGKVDLKYTKDAVGGYYYKDHLPKLGEVGEQNPQRAATDGPTVTYCVGDKVKVILTVDVLKAMQEGHGGWNPKMAEYVGKIGLVHRVTDRGDIRVTYPGCGTRWTYHTAALSKVNSYATGDEVTILSDMALVKRLQSGHGEWSEGMATTLGKKGKILKIYSDGDLRVSVDKQVWTFNPACLTPIERSSKPDLNNTMTADRAEELQGNLHELLQEILTLRTPNESPDKLVSEAAQGNTRTVTELISKHPDWVNARVSGKTALQVASHQGHLEVIKVLSLGKVTMELQDQDGDTALHYAVFGKQPDIVEYLISKNADMNVVNKGSCSSLHVAVNKGFVDCVRVLLRHRCNANLQDLYGDTALHDAIAKDNRDIIDLLVEAHGADLSLKNRRGFNVLHHAALKGNKYATEKLVTKARQLVNLKKDDGYAALHLAALNGHRDVAETLLVQGHGDLNVRNNRRQTPLILAAGQGHTHVIELMVTKGAEVSAEDEDGDTSLHLALVRQEVYAERDDSPIIQQYRTKIVSGLVVNMAIASVCFLVQAGGSLTHRNHQSKSPLDLVLDIKIKNYLLQLYEQRRQKQRQDKDAKHGRRRRSASQERLLASSRGDTPGTSTSQNVNPMSSGASPPPSGTSTSQNVNPMSSGASPPPSAGTSQNVRGPSTPAGPPAPAGPSTPAGPPASSVEGPSGDSPANLEAMMSDCRMCQKPANCQFKPCGHQVACMDCAVLFQKCFSCKAEVKDRVRVEEKKCAICSTNKAEVTFSPCGHKNVCRGCCNKEKSCRACQQPVREMLDKAGHRISMSSQSGSSSSQHHQRPSSSKQGAKAAQAPSSSGSLTPRGASSSSSRVSKEEELKKLKEQYQQMEEEVLCPICMENKRNVVFLCGHSVCKKCSRPLKQCPLCRKPITKKIALFT
ncbi:E3 ubiquitin-protein ligase MIB2 isoform X3 [Strongylocentrotus purpuratus]|uniref:RING-type E3 ubiquitin transferase n=1 Tax=Strongylocentrotus purpuratus TaxID=7668 RepID=A0A7M7NX05_STRPU|nr:E3 ubiquitin-protein ligase MIB2 isoform X3 [Strongylocentrotus purpuratus]